MILRNDNHATHLFNNDEIKSTEFEKFSKARVVFFYILTRTDPIFHFDSGNTFFLFICSLWDKKKPISSVMRAERSLEGRHPMYRNTITFWTTHTLFYYIFTSVYYFCETEYIRIWHGLVLSAFLAYSLINIMICDCEYIG